MVCRGNPGDMMGGRNNVIKNRFVLFVFESILATQHQQRRVRKERV